MKHDERYYLDLIDEIERIRGKNNKNWMDILRLAFRHAAFGHHKDRRPTHGRDANDPPLRKKHEKPLEPIVAT
jgi:hypothetical protein